MRACHSDRRLLADGRVAVHVAGLGLPVVVDGLAGGARHLRAPLEAVGQAAGRTQLCTARHVQAVDDLLEGILIPCGETNLRLWLLS